MPPRAKLQTIDYAVLIGGPLICLFLVWFGIRAIVGSGSRPNPVAVLRDGAVSIGATADEVERKVGPPGRVQKLEDGGFLYVYTRTVYEEATKSDSLDEATVEFTPGGRVQGIRFERGTPPAVKD